MATYFDKNVGEERADKRNHPRDEDDDPRIASLHSGFRNMIANSDRYSEGYLKAMQREFAALTRSLMGFK